MSEHSQEEIRSSYRPCSVCGDPAHAGVVHPSSLELCELHEVPMTDGVCSCCLADAEHDGR